MQNKTSVQILQVLLGVVIGALVTLSVVKFQENRHLLRSRYQDWGKLNLILKTVEDNYVDSVDVASITDAAVQAVLAKLDPHSMYFPPVELAASQEIFDRPMHPYTEALMNAIPTTDVESDRKIQILEGDIPSPVHPPKGCKFHTRCKYCTEVCEHVEPEWVEAAPNHFVACHHMLNQNK